MMYRIIIIISSLLFATSASAELDKEKFEEYSRAVVRTIVDGTLIDDKPCKPKGTGFFIDSNGHILTAGHNVLPCREGDLGSSMWKTPPKIQVEQFHPDPDPGKSKLEKVTAVLIYVDEQTDLALLRANVGNPVWLDLAPPGTLRAGAGVSVMTFDTTQAQPADKQVTIESLFNPSKRHKGLIDISGPDMKPSASGGPLFDEYSYVAGVFTKGEHQTGEAAVPITYGSLLFSMSGVSYPSNEVREVISELRKDMVNWDMAYNEITDIITVSFEKRLKAGVSPSKLIAEVHFFVLVKEGLSKSEHAVGQKIFEKNVKRKQTKEDKVTFDSIGEGIQNEIDTHNEHVKADPSSGKRWYKKTKAEVTIIAEFPNGQKIFPIKDEEIKFD